MKIKIKPVIVGMVTTAAAFGFGYFLKIYLMAYDSATLGLTAGLAIIFLALFILQSMFIKNRLAALGLITMEALVMAVNFYNHIALLSLLAVFLILLFFSFWAHYAAQVELDNAFKIRLAPAGRMAVAKVGTALALFATVMFMSRIHLDDAVVVKKFIASSISPIQPLLMNTVSQVVPQALSGLVQPQKLLSTPALTDMIYQATVKPILKLPPLYQTLIMWGIGFLVFITIKSFLFIIHYAALGLAYVLWQILKAVKFFEIQIENRPKEVVIL